jgi:acetyl-CoA acetyltransferase
MREAVIVSYARTGLAKAGRGGFNATPPMSMAAHAIKHAVAKSGVELTSSRTATWATTPTAPPTSAAWPPCWPACR